MAQTGTAIFPAQPTTTTFAGSFPGTQAIPGGSEFSGATLAPENNLYPGSTTFAGQGQNPLLWALIAYDDLSDGTPFWADITSKVRSFQIQRAEGQAGTANLVLDNRTRAFDPTFNSSVRPNNRVWLLEQFSGETNSMFFGYTNSYSMQWPGGGWSDAVANVSCTDEYKRLTFKTLPTTSPPRSSYSELVAFDAPAGQWGMDEDPVTATQPSYFSTADTIPENEDTTPPPLRTPAPLRRAFPKHGKKPPGRKPTPPRRRWR